MRPGRRVLLIVGVLIACALLAFTARAWLSRSRPSSLPPDWDAVVITAAGSGVAGVRDGASFHAQFSDPFGVAVAPDGTIYVADGAGSHRVRRISPDGLVTTIAGGAPGVADGPARDARFSTPSGLALAPDGTLYLADTGNNAVRRISPTGHVSTLAGADAGLNGPVGVAVDRRGRVIVADTYNDRIRAIEPDGRIVDVAGGAAGFADGEAAEARFDTPCGVAVDASNNIYVADTGNGAVRVISPTGLVSTISPGYTIGNLRPVGIAAAADGSVFVTDDGGRIVHITGNRGERVLAGSTRGFRDGGGAEARFRSPAGVAIASSGEIVVADRRNALVRRVRAQQHLPLHPPAPPLRPTFSEESFDREPLLWPFAPLEGPFEITGTLGEPRGSVGGERLHAGLDVHAPEGAAVRVVRTATVDDPMGAADFGSLNESVRVGPVTYVHLRVGRTHDEVTFVDDRYQWSFGEDAKPRRVRLKRGAVFSAGEVIGTVNRFYHAHLNVGWPGEEVNPLRFRLIGYEDTISPSIARGGVRAIDEAGVPLTRREKGRVIVHGRFRVVVDAWDQVNGNQARRRLGLYRLGYQLLHADGSSVAGYETPVETLRFDRHPASGSAAARTVYAGGSGIPVYGNRSSRFLYVVTATLRDGVAADGALDAAALAPGDYLIRILAADISGNVALANRDLPITVSRPAEQ